MFEIIKNVINSKDYKLEDMLYKILKWKKYVCKLDNCVWSPDTYPNAWEEVAE